MEKQHLAEIEKFKEKTRRLSEEVETAEQSIENKNLKDTIVDKQPIINKKKEKKYFEKKEKKKNGKNEKLVYIKISKTGSTTLHTIFDSYGYINRMSLIIPRTNGKVFLH